MAGKGSADLSFDHLKEGDRRTVTVLFADLAGFTSIAEKLDPEETDALMTRIFEDFEAIIRRHDGTVEKYIGDALVAVFGAPRIHEDDPSRAVNAALDMNHRIAGTKGSSAGNGRLLFRTGIHTGLITTGTRGDHNVVTGNTMNIASRLQSAADPGSILISEDTLEECGGEFTLGPMLETRVKGLQQAIKAYQVLGRNPHSLKPDPYFTGRDELLQEILTSYLRFDGRAPGGIILSGEAGIGKTALVKQFLDQLRHYPDFDAPILHARARRFHGRPFAVISDCFLNLLHLTADSDPQAITAKLTTQLGMPEASAASFLSLLESADLDASASQHLALLTEFAEHLIEKRPKGPYMPIIFLDNGEFIDPQTLDFLRFYLRKCEVFPFLVITDREPCKDIQDLAPEIPVREILPLDTLGAAALLKTLLDHHGIRIKQEERERILGNSAGNPLFIHSYLHWILDRENPEIPEVYGEIPTEIQNVYLAELSSYNEAERELLVKLSVFQHSFTYDDAVWIQEQTDGDPEIVRQALELFQQEDIIAQDQQIYFFRHDVRKNALYSSLLHYNRKILHRLTARRMQQQEDPHPVRYIHHLVRSESYMEALEHYQRVPDRSINMTYLPYLEVMSEHIPQEKLDEKLLLLFARGSLLFNNGQINQAEIMVQEILDIAIKKQRADFAARAYHLLAANNTKSYRFQTVYFCGIKALDMYTRSGLPRKYILNLLLIMISSESIQNHRERAELLMERLVSLGQNQGRDIELELARVEYYYHSKQYREAWELYSKIPKPEAGRMKETKYLGRRFAYLLAWERYDLEALAIEAAAILETPLLDPMSRSQACAYLAHALAILGGEDGSGGGSGPDPGDFLNQAAFNALRCQNDFDRLEAEATRAAVLISMKRFDEAEAVAREHLPGALRHSAFSACFRLLMVLAELAFYREDMEELRHCLIEAGHIYRLGMALSHLELITYLYLSHQFSQLIEGGLDQELLELTNSFLVPKADGCEDESIAARGQRQRASDEYLTGLSGVFQTLLAYLADPRARERFLKLRLMGQAYEYMKDRV